MMQLSFLDLAKMDDPDLREPWERCFDAYLGNGTVTEEARGAVRFLFQCEERYERIYYSRGLIQGVRFDAYQRAKALRIIYGRHPLEGWKAGDESAYLDICNPHLDYHVIWDRAWAARNGVPKERIPDVMRWDYSKKRAVRK